MTTQTRRCFLQYAGLTAGSTVLAGLPALAEQTYPSRPLSLVVPYPAGGASDTSARIFGESISKSVRQQVVVENYGGGTGLIGANKVLAAPADGYTFFHGSINEVFLSPLLNPAARYKPQDFMLAAPISDASIVLLIRSGIPADSLDKFLDVARQNKSKPLTYATVGIDSIYHLMGDALGARIGAPFLHVPYKGAAPALQGLAGGEVDFAILPYQSSFDSMQEQGRLKVLTSFSRSLPAPLKHIPLISQSRQVPDFEYAISGATSSSRAHRPTGSPYCAKRSATRWPNLRSGQAGSRGPHRRAAHRQSGAGEPALRPVHGSCFAAHPQRGAQDCRLNSG